VEARKEAGGRRQEENNYGIKTGFDIRTKKVPLAQQPGK
jgi:hypothetical protein